MTVANTKTLLQAKHAAITGVTTASTAMPDTVLNPANFPQVLLMTGPAQHRTLAGKTETTRTYEAWVFLYEKKKDYYAQAATDADTFIQRFLAMYTDPANKTLANPPDYVYINSHDLESVQDTGFSTLVYLDTEYYGFIFRVRITEFD